ncbi:hypothetical protein RvY_14190-1 [Ramazzottius varieornatus]|uniref:riboflavin kinase n=1 Tax=Ramazzottius varieornatus TaxID=947166 RepID=A0A1D1VQG8_RAMVA|nr:hypothetical protein RvY_14190-1 [Ramazzottius varieornatus]
MAKDTVKEQGLEMSCLPFLAEGRVVKGFGRGSKQLGIPTANFTQDVVDTMPTDMIEGVYYGLANVDGGSVSRMVMSVGHNLHFANAMRTMETHILRSFADDFYGGLLRVMVLGFIREMESYTSLDALIAAIHSDIDIANKALSEERFASCYDSDFFKHGFAVVTNGRAVQSDGTSS